MAKWVTVEEVAKHLQCSASKLRNDIFNKEGVGKLFYKVGGLRRADIDEVDAFLKDSK